MHKKMSQNNNIWNDMAKYLAGEMDDLEQKWFMEQVEADDSLKTQLEEMKSTWMNFDSNPSSKFRDTGKAWNNLKDSLEKDGLLNDSGKRINTFFLRPVVRIAASILLVVGLGIPAVYFTIINDSSNTGNMVHASTDGVSTLDLPDGSRVFMNKGAVISYPETFREDRILKLRGEAFFEVMSDPQKPFRVNSGKIMVSVIGTSFNVKQDDHNPVVEVFVETGKVQVSGTETDDLLTLVPGTVGYSNGETMSQDNQENQNYLSWKTKEFIFVDESVPMILQTLEKAYHVEIVSEGKDIKDLRLTSTYMQQSVEAILETISAAFSLELEKKGDTYYLN